jgi:hypothetical protein
MAFPAGPKFTAGRKLESEWDTRIEANDHPDTLYLSDSQKFMFVILPGSLSGRQPRVEKPP